MPAKGVEIGVTPVEKTLSPAAERPPAPVLPPPDKAKILDVIERLDAGGSTAGADGIRQAYALAERNFDPNGVNPPLLDAESTLQDTLAWWNEWSARCRFDGATSAGGFATARAC